MESFIINNKQILTGALIGLVVAILLITIGFFKTVLIILCTGIGIFVGYYTKKTHLIESIFK